MAQRVKHALASWVHPKKSGIRIQPVFNAHGGEKFGASYLVTVPARLTGKLRERRQFKVKAEAEEWAETMSKGHRQQGADFFSLTETERREIANLLPTLRERGVSISEAIRFAAKHLRVEGRNKSLAEVVAELLESKVQREQRGDLRPSSLHDFKVRSRKFLEGFDGRLVAEITAEEIKTWLLGLKVGPRSVRNYLSILGEIFTLATQRRYIGFSPLDSISDVDRKNLAGTGEAKEPAILTVGEAERLVLAAKDHPDLDLFGAVVLGLFCGLRSGELKRLDWSDVKLAEASPIVTVGARIAKKRRIRNVEIPANAVLWLSLAAKPSGPVAPTADNDFHHRFRKLVKHAKIKRWESNAMRHSFGSYHYALHGNPLETSRLLGHKASDQVLFDHYRALATKADAEAYFAIRPPAETGKIVRFG